jgi:RNA polymerase-binding transcription factor DksA
VEAETLRARRAEVQARLRSLDRSFDDIVGSIEGVGNDDEHDPDGSTIAFERAQLMALRNAAVVELDELDAALARLDHGTFGACVACGQSIAPERLVALPATRTCIACAR